GAIGLLDDYFKIRAKQIAQRKGVPYKKGDADGLAGKFKIVGQVMLGIVVGATLYFNDNVKIWREYIGTVKEQSVATTDTTNKGQFHIGFINGKKRTFVEAKTVVTTIPFVKNHEFNYSKLL